MRKFLLIITASLFTSSAANVVIACQSLNLGEIWIITDGGELFDHAFNQQVVEGAQQFAKDFNKNRDVISQLPQFGYWKNQPMRIRWIISNGNNISTLQNNYNIAAFCGAKVIICSGFHHLTSLTWQVQSLYKKYGIRFILVDSIFNNPINVAGITYSAEQSGFLAGLAAAIWLVANHEKYQKNSNDKLKMSTFGAVPAESIVSYMNGYYWGVSYFNRFREKEEEGNKLLDLVNALRNKKITLADLQKDNLTIDFDKLSKSFSGGFDTGTPDVNAITSTIVDTTHNNVIMPVAGAQTKDLIGAIKSSTTNSNAKIIGVDTNQASLYSTASDLFITSALKGINPSIDWMLWNAFKLKNNQGKISVNHDTEKYFNQVNQPLSDSQYIGIANNEPISSIYDYLTTPDSPYWQAAKSVTEAFERLTKTVNGEVKPDWEDAWLNYVDPNKAPQYDPFFIKKDKSY